MHLFLKGLEHSVDTLLNWLVSSETTLRSKETVNMDVDTCKDELIQAQVLTDCFVHSYRSIKSCT